MRSHTRQELEETSTAVRSHPRQDFRQELSRSPNANRSSSNPLSWSPHQGDLSLRVPNKIATLDQTWPKLSAMANSSFFKNNNFNDKPPSQWALQDLPRQDSAILTLHLMFHLQEEHLQLHPRTLINQISFHNPPQSLSFLTTEADK